MNKLKIGDTIKCIDAEDAVNLMEELLRGGGATAISAMR